MAQLPQVFYSDSVTMSVQWWSDWHKHWQSKFDAFCADENAGNLTTTTSLPRCAPHTNSQRCSCERYEGRHKHRFWHWQGNILFFGVHQTLKFKANAPSCLMAGHFLGCCQFSSTSSLNDSLALKVPHLNADQTLAPVRSC